MKLASKNPQQNSANLLSGLQEMTLARAKGIIERYKSNPAGFPMHEQNTLQRALRYIEESEQRRLKILDRKNMRSQIEREKQIPGEKNSKEYCLGIINTLRQKFSRWAAPDRREAVMCFLENHKAMTAYEIVMEMDARGIKNEIRVPQIKELAKYINLSMLPDKKEHKGFLGDKEADKLTDWLNKNAHKHTLESAFAALKSMDNEFDLRACKEKNTLKSFCKGYGRNIAFLEGPTYKGNKREIIETGIKQGKNSQQIAEMLNNSGVKPERKTKNVKELIFTPKQVSAYIRRHNLLKCLTEQSQ